MSASRQRFRISSGMRSQRQRLGDRRPRLAQPPGEVLVGIAAARGQALQRLGLFERRQVLALEVLDQRDLEHLGIVDVADDGRQFAQADLDRRLIAPLAGDDLEPLAALADDQRLDDALLGDRGHQLREVAHHLPRLVRVGIDLLDRDQSADRHAGRCRPAPPHNVRRGASTMLSGSPRLDTIDDLLAEAVILRRARSSRART